MGMLGQGFITKDDLELPSLFMARKHAMSKRLLFSYGHNGISALIFAGTDDTNDHIQSYWLQKFHRQITLCCFNKSPLRSHTK